MKVTIAYQCDLEDIPKTVGELLSVLKEVNIGDVSTFLLRAERECAVRNVSEALTEIDSARIQLNKIDQRLMDYSAILAGYASADTNMKMGKPPTEIAEEGEISSDQTNSSSESESE